MKWLENPPDDWNSVSDEPPDGTSTYVPLEAEVGTGGVVIREPGTEEAYLRATAGAIDLEDCA